MKFRLKIVPDHSPNADGRWIETKSMGVVETAIYRMLPRREQWDLYQAHCPAGFHVVAVEEVKT